MSEENLTLYVPVDLGEENSLLENEHGKFISGYATSPNKDREGQTILSQDIDINNFLSHGYINYEHNHDPEYIIGVPTVGTHIDDYGLYVEAKLFMDNPYAKSMWDLAKNLKESGVSKTKHLGFSIEASYQGVYTNNPGQLKNVSISNVALTTNPANWDTTKGWELIEKSMTTGYGLGLDKTDAGVLRDQGSSGLAKRIQNLSYALGTLEECGLLDWGEVTKSLDEEDRFDPRTAQILLQLSKGLSSKEAKNKIYKD